jgi:hypothetical protein
LDSLLIFRVLPLKLLISITRKRRLGWKNVALSFFQWAKARKSNFVYLRQIESLDGNVTLLNGDSVATVGACFSIGLMPFELANKFDRAFVTIQFVVGTEIPK